MKTQQLKLPIANLRVADLPNILGHRLVRLPHVVRQLCENHLRAGHEVGPVLAALDTWLEGQHPDFEFQFQPNRILMHDTTCTPALADIAGLRDAMAEAGADPALLEPVVPVDVSIDHSVAVDVFAQPNALSVNMANEMHRNAERYQFMKWASQSLNAFTVHPPGTGIMHTLNLEQLSKLLVIDDTGLAHPDMLLGTDSHTPMINGIGVLAWGVGGLEAESVMFGSSASLAFPKVVGVKLSGKLPAGTLSTDLALEVTHQLRKFGVAGSYVEFFGDGVASLSADARATVANMAPEYGAATGFFPVDREAVDYLARTGRPEELVSSIEPAFRAMGLWFNPLERPQFDREIEIDLSSLSPTIAGPRRPQDSHNASEAQSAVEAVLDRTLADLPTAQIPDGAVVIAAITSCTNTSDPRLLITAGLLARKARTYGLTPPDWVKTSLAPGSPSAREYLHRVGLDKDLSAVGFDIVGFGCTTCIGNSGPLPADAEIALTEGKAVVAVLSGNRNFPGRVHPKLNLAFLASPPLVIAFALRGHVHGDVLRDPLGKDRDGNPVTLEDIWPGSDEVEGCFSKAFCPADVATAFTSASGGVAWADLKAPTALTYPWNTASRVLRKPKFASTDETTRLGRYSATPLMVLGDDMTTDHISPAGWIDPKSAAGKWLISKGGDAADLNVYAAYRGNWEVMVRGLFTNRLARNYLDYGPDVAMTINDQGQRHPLYSVSQDYANRGVASVILAGERYGMGSSRDWAAKGVALLGVKAVIARSFERIHRSNLIGMGVLPLQIMDDFVPQNAQIGPADKFDIEIMPAADLIGINFNVTWRQSRGAVQTIAVRAAVETKQDAELLRAGGVMPTILRARL